MSDQGRAGDAQYEQRVRAYERGLRRARIRAWIVDPPQMVKTVLIIAAWEIGKALAHAI